ncbi:hypothetical protein [Hymenobacter terricola]|uniref:hypothetical protein n=1 Tax=Hymenobacter terricola TaxID=2819236 RepID=UPI001B307CB1|nr:hypothetical protein [Hymenobacter terricola]
MNSAFTTPLPLPAELDFLRLRYRPDLHTLVARWQRPVLPAELRQGYAAILQAAEATACPVWLVDLRGRNAPATAEAHWLNTEFLPQLPGRLGGLVCLGFLVSPHFGEQFALAAVAIQSASYEPLTVRYFEDEGRLTHWLAQCPPGY